MAPARRSGQPDLGAPLLRVFEHFERFLTPAASRPGPPTYFVWILLGGLVPWTGFLFNAVREAVRGGWAQRKENLVAWFLIVWAAFVFLFFSASKSKLPPYILPIFPALAVLIGMRLAHAMRVTDGGRGLRTSFWINTAVNGLLAVALMVVVLRPALLKLTPERAQALQGPAVAMAVALLGGAAVALWCLHRRSLPSAVLSVLGSSFLFFGALQFAAPNINKPGTKDLALIVKARAKPGDRVMHYHEFFHGFTFYAQCVVDVIAFKGELETEEDEAARNSGRFWEEAAFRDAWKGPARLWVVARRRDVATLFADQTFCFPLIAQTGDHYLFSNQPASN